VSKERRILLLVTLVLILIRLILLQQYVQNNPFYTHPVLDSSFYLQWADAIRSGKQFFQEEYHHPPGYAFFLAGLLGISGGNFYAVLLVQSLMLALQGFLVFLITQRLAGSRAAWLAFGLFSLCGPLVFYSMKILSETLLITLSLSAFYFLICSNLLLSGFLLGAAIEVRGTAIVYLLPIVIALAGKERRRRAMLFFAGLVICILPVLIRNVVVSGHWTPVASNWGENFYMANNPYAAGSFSSIPGVRANLQDQIQDIKAEASRRSGRKLNSIEAQRFWFHEGIRFISEQPHAWLALIGKKVHRIFSRNEASTMYFYELETQYFQPSLKFLFINTTWILPLFFIGIAFAPGNPETKTLFGFIAAHGLLLLIFWPELRFLLPALPFLLIAAGFAAAGERPVLRRAVVAAFGLVGWLIFNWIPIPGTAGREAWFTNASSAYYANEEIDPAIAMAYQAIRINPRYADAWVDLGAALYAKGQKEEARAAWNNALKIQPGHPVALRNLQQAQ
jgi:4-amino-4-deoxy-L-arabinose transferase-like glycosyltransferase